MRVLLNECLPRKLKRELHGHHVSTVPEMARCIETLRLLAPQILVALQSIQPGDLVHIEA